MWRCHLLNKEMLRPSVQTEITFRLHDTARFYSFLLVVLVFSAVFQVDISFQYRPEAIPRSQYQSLRSQLFLPFFQAFSSLDLPFCF